MTYTIWGPKILVTITNDERPEFVSAGKRCAIWVKDAWHGEGGKMEARDWMWHGGITAIKLLFDSPYYKKVEQMTDTPITLEALEAAAKLLCLNPDKAAKVCLEYPDSNQPIQNVARLLMQYKSDLIVESFEARTEREFGNLSLRNDMDAAYESGAGLRGYRRYIQQHIKDAKP
jgi:hypothetical protein